MSKSKRKKVFQSEIKQCKYYVNGMHCASCEVLIEKKLLKKYDDLEFVDASLAKGELNISYKGSKPTEEELNSIFHETGYMFSQKKYYKDLTPLISIKNGFLSINTDKMKTLLRTLFLFIVFVVLFKTLEKSGLASGISVSSSSSYPAFFLFGIVAGLSSCAALIGGLLLSLSKQWSEVYIYSSSKVQKLIPFTMFNIGRIISFTLLGGLLGLLGGTLGLTIEGSSTFTTIGVVLVSLIMAILGLQMLGIEWASKFQFKVPKFISRKITSEEDFQGKYMPLVVGALTFFLPCGFTITAQALALTSGSFLSGAMILLFFSLGTLPILALISLTSVEVSKRPKLNATFNYVAGALVLFFALYNFNAQLNVLGLKSLSDIKLPSYSAPKTSGTSVVEPDKEGYQIINLTASGFEYEIKSGSKIKAGVPTKLVVQNNGIQGCGSYLLARGLMNNYVQLKPGRNEIDLGTPQKGVYKITCTMGMVSPVTVEVI
ncbi:sulfite exporter TauE/SafE family protein [Candidatus Dojkabacteria bacterium]|nr:sulfite exporter TauE/SafE family protein [Candidatus Dojkabacteria bacterium]